MKNIRTAVTSGVVFLMLSGCLFLLQYLLQQNGTLVLDYRIHILLFAVTVISIFTMLVVYVIGKKDIIGFVFLGFVVFKMFAIGYIAVFETDFKNALIPYFVLYWIYLLMEVVLVVRLVRKQD